MTDDPLFDDGPARPALSPLRTSPEIGEIAGALAKAQGAYGGLEKNRQVKIRTRDRGSGVGEYEFAYATIDKVFDALRSALSENGIAYIQPICGDRLVTRLMHGSGQWIEGDVALDRGSSMQTFGSSVSYLKRYSITAICGIAAEDDDDANIAEGNQIASRDGNDLWGGPLSKTALKTALREMVTEIESCSDLDQLIAFMDNPEPHALIEQCRRDMPAWYFGQKGSEVSGLKARLDAKRKALEEREGMGMLRPVGDTEAAE